MPASLTLWCPQTGELFNGQGLQQHMLAGAAVPAACTGSSTAATHVLQCLSTSAPTRPLPSVHSCPTACDSFQCKTCVVPACRHGPHAGLATGKRLSQNEDGGFDFEFVSSTGKLIFQNARLHFRPPVLTECVCIWRSSIQSCLHSIAGCRHQCIRASHRTVPAQQCM